MRLLPAFVVLLAASAHAQSPSDILRAPSHAVRAADLPDGYRAVALGTGEEGFGGLGIFAMSGFAMRGGSAEESQSALLFSLTGASFVDPDEFAQLLDGKRPRIRAYTLDLTAMMAASTRGVRTPAPIFTESWIETGRVTQWSPRPGLTKAAILSVFGNSGRSGDMPADRSTALSNVKQVALALLIYSTDNDDRFPKADSSAKARALTHPYTKSDELWQTPGGTRVLYNVALSGVSSTSLSDPAATLLVWEEKPASDGTRAIAFTDGHAKRVSESEWDRLWSAELGRRAHPNLAKARVPTPTRRTARP